jgi:hypothetical protein
MDLILVSVLVASFGVLIVLKRPQLSIVIGFFWFNFLILPTIKTLAFVEHTIVERYFEFALDALPFYIVYLVGLYIAAPKFHSTQFNDYIPLHESFQLNWAILFVLGGAFGLEVLIRGIFGVLVAGIAEQELLLSLPGWVSPTISILRLFSLAFFIYGTIQIERLSGWIARALLFSALFSFVVFVLISGGRSHVVFCMICGYIVWSKRLIPRVRAMPLLYGVLTITVFIVLTPIWVLARVYYVDFREVQQLNVVSAIYESFHAAVLKSTEGTHYLNGFEENMKGRGNVGQFFLTLIGSCKSLLLGEAVVLGVWWALPSLLVAKPERHPEELIQTTCALPLGDEATAVLSYLSVDFGWPGALLAGLFVGAIINLLFFVSLNKNRTDLTRVLCLSAFFQLSFMQEAEFASYLVICRDLLLVGIVLELVTRLSRVSISRRRYL